MKIINTSLIQIIAFIAIIRETFAINWNGNNWALGCDFVGNDLSNVRSRSEDCGGKCENTAGCTHFTWTNFNGGTCWMKKNGATKDNAIDTGDNSMVCGVNGQSTELDFPGCQFRLGRSYDDNLSDSSYNNVDYISIWINTISSEFGTDFNQYYQGKMIDLCLSKNKLPVFYAYIIAFEARHKEGFQDCDVDNTNNLCVKGASFIRNNRNLILDRYRHQASSIASRLGSNKPAIFLIEPDFWQFYGDTRQNGGTLSGDYMRDLFNDMVNIIKQNLPQAMIAWDISAWIGQDGFRNYWSNFENSQIDFIFTSGGQAHGESANIKPNELTWSFVSQTTGKKIIADCGYGVGGGAASNCNPWYDQTNLNNRKNDGVIALTQANNFQSISPVPKFC